MQTIQFNHWEYRPSNCDAGTHRVPSPMSAAAAAPAAATAAAATAAAAVTAAAAAVAPAVAAAAAGEHSSSGEQNIHRADRQIRRFAFRTVEFADRECRTSNSKMWCVDLSDRAVQNDDSEYRPSTALIWRADRHVLRLALMTVEFDHWECRASNSMLSTVDRQAPTILAWRIKVL